MHKLTTLDKYVIFSISVLLIYTVVSLLLFQQTQVEITTLTTCFFGTFGGEILTCALIKIFKLRKENNES